MNFYPIFAYFSHISMHIYMHIYMNVYSRSHLSGALPPRCGIYRMAGTAGIFRLFLEKMQIYAGCGRKFKALHLLNY